MNAIEKEILDKFLKLLSKKTRVHRLILFGSRARGDADSHSDMDVIVVLGSKRNRELRDFVSDCAWEAGFEHGIVVVPVLFSQEEWETGPERFSLLAQAVESEGIAL